MYNFFAYRQQNHLDKTCPQWIKYTTVVINKRQDQQALDEQEQETEQQKSTDLKDNIKIQLCCYWTRLLIQDMPMKKMLR